MNKLQESLDKLKKQPIASYVKRYWYILAIAIVIVTLYNLTALGTMLRGSVMIPMMAFIALCTALLLRNVFNTRSSDSFVDDKEGFKDAWDELSSYEKMFLTKLEFGLYFVGCCILGCGLLIIINVS